MKKKAALALLPSLLLGACSVVGIRDTPEPPSTVIGHVGAVEIRQYPATAAAETTVTGSELYARSIGFQRLFAYITGSNTGRHNIAMTAPVAQAPAEAPAEKIAMTAPVAQTPAPGGAWTVRFFLPPTMTVETAPQPSDRRVVIVPVPSRIMGVLRFSGQATPYVVSAEGRRLDALLAGSAWDSDGPLVAWFYDPPWTLPPFRRNEVVRPLKPRPPLDPQLPLPAKPSELQ